MTTIDPKDLRIGSPIRIAEVNLFPVLRREPAGTVASRGSRAPGALDGALDVVPARPDTVVISELDRPVVGTVRIENRGDRPALVPGGSIVSGGLQNRMVDASVVVPAGGGLDVPVSCVEAHRWAGGDATFRLAPVMATRRVRRAASASIHESLTDGGPRDPDQGLIWDLVDHELERAGTSSATSDLRALTSRVEPSVEGTRGLDELLERRPEEDQVGLVVARGERLVAVELFGSSELLAANWGPLVRAHLAEAPSRRVGAPPSAEAALTFLARALATPGVETEGIGAGVEEHVLDRRFTGSTLSLEGRLVQGSWFVLAA